jgi:hypothetical protein
MKSKELSRMLLKNPDHRVILSIDVSTCEEDAFLRAHAEDIEVVQVNNEDSVSIISIGKLNNDTDVEKLQKENIELNKAVDEMIKDRDYYHDENEKLQLKNKTYHDLCALMLAGYKKHTNVFLGNVSEKGMKNKVDNFCRFYEKAIKVLSK